MTPSIYPPPMTPSTHPPTPSHPPYLHLSVTPLTYLPTCVIFDVCLFLPQYFFCLFLPVSLPLSLTECLFVSVYSSTHFFFLSLGTVLSCLSFPRCPHLFICLVPYIFISLFLPTYVSLSLSLSLSPFLSLPVIVLPSPLLSFSFISYPIHIFLFLSSCIISLSKLTSPLSLFTSLAHLSPFLYSPSSSSSPNPLTCLAYLPTSVPPLSPASLPPALPYATLKVFSARGGSKLVKFGM